MSKGYASLESPESIPKVFVGARNNRDAFKLPSPIDEVAKFVNVTGLWWHDREAIRKAQGQNATITYTRRT